jgi:hypothetical protein
MRNQLPVWTERQKVGLPFSPWFEYVSRYETVVDPDGGTHHNKSESGRVLWVSWSWLLLGGAAG